MPDAVLGGGAEEEDEDDDDGFFNDIDPVPIMGERKVEGDCDEKSTESMEKQEEERRELLAPHSFSSASEMGSLGDDPDFVRDIMEGDDVDTTPSPPSTTHSLPDAPPSFPQECTRASPS